MAPSPAAAGTRRAAPPGACALAAMLSFDVGRRGCVAALDEGTLAVATGSGIVLLALPSLTQRHLPSRDGGGVGAIALHPGGACFAVAERCRERAPNM